MGKDDLASLALVADIGRRQGVACGLPAAVDLDVAALGIGRQAIGHGTARQFLPGRPRPCLFLASNLGDFRRANVLHHAPESRARLDGGKLLVIAQQDDFCPGLLGGFQHAAKLAAAYHARLVDHENIAGSELVLSVLPRKFKTGERAAFDAAASLQFVGRLACQRRASHVEALGLPRLAGYLHGEGFARAGVADDNGQAARLENVPDSVLLLGRQGARAINRGVRDRAGNAMPSGARQALGALHHAALSLDHFAGGELRRIAAVRRFHLDQQRRVFQLGKQALELPGVVNVAVQLGGNVAAREYGLRRRDLV